MSHALHFLSRLERLEPSEVEVALKLYRDTNIVTEAIAREVPSAPRGRVALALSNDPRSPHVVVTTSGDFVTCLGAGMSTSGLPVVSKAGLAAVMERQRRERLADEMIGAKGKGSRVISRLINPRTLSREEMLAISAFTRDLGTFLARQMVRCLPDVMLGRVRCEVDPRPNRCKTFAAFSQQQGALSTLLGLNGPAIFEKPASGNDLATLLIIGALRTGSTPVFARALWTAARMGRARLAALKKAFVVDDERTSLQLIEIVAIGLANASLAVEARAFVACAARSNPIYADLEEVLRGPEKHTETLLARAREHASVVAPKLRLSDVDAVALLLSEGTFLDPQTSNIICALPYIARCEAEHLYLPQAILASLRRREFEPSKMRAMIATINALRPAQVPFVRATRRPSRNAPCPCGTEHKFKRCCF